VSSFEVVSTAPLGPNPIEYTIDPGLPPQLVSNEKVGSPDAREFFRVGKLIPAGQVVVTVPPKTGVAEALAIMNKNGFSQLPVVAGNTVIGVFTFRSLALRLANLRPQDNPLNAHVDDLVDPPSFVRASEEVEEILAPLDRDGFVIVGHEKHMDGVVTATDMFNFLWKTTQPFVLLQDIEFAIRYLMRSACGSGEELAERIAVALNPEVEAPCSALDELTLGQTLTVLRHGDNFGRCFSTTFGDNRALVNRYLDHTPAIRNKVFHFRDDITDEERTILFDTRLWLWRRVEIAKAR